MLFYLWGVFKGSQKNGLDHGVGEIERSRKKEEADASGTSGCNSSRERNLLRDGFACQACDLNDDSTVAENPRSDDCGNGVTVKGMEGWKELNPADSSIPGNSVSSSENEARCHADAPVPDLELALGAEMKSPSKGFSFWVDQNKFSSSDVRAPTPKDNEEDECSASLSLSLSFPFPKEE